MTQILWIKAVFCNYICVNHYNLRHLRAKKTQGKNFRIKKSIFLPPRLSAE
jgi:hypothetical protein